MFTGIITEIGKIKSRPGNELIITAPKTVEDLNLGDSISINGVCLTVTKKDTSTFKVDLLKETFCRTNLGKLKIYDSVNLELALKAGGRMGGHMVTGHIDGVGKLIRNYKKGGDRVLEIEAPFSTAKYLVSKGSIAIDGVSLTIVKVIRNIFTVHLIPFTLKYTTLGIKKTGSLLNIEVDILARYAKTG